MKTGIKVGDAMTRNPVIVKPDSAIAYCAKKMLKNGVGGVLVSEKDKSLGIITEKDIVKRVVSRKKDPTKITARDIMTKVITSISPEKDLYDAIKLMSTENIRRMPVISERKLIGILTMNDILRIQPTLFELVVSDLNIKEEENKIMNGGNCENCDSRGMLFKVGNKWLCSACK